MAHYHIVVIHDNNAWSEQLKQLVLNELQSLSLPSDLIQFQENLPCDEYNQTVCVYLGSRQTATSARVLNLIESAKEAEIFIVPVCEVGHFGRQIPNSLGDFQAYEIANDTTMTRLAQLLLRELGITEKERGVFISYRRSDAKAIAVQLYDELSHRGFRCILDAFDVEPGERVQSRLMEEIDNSAFLLLIESPDAYQSQWIIREVHQALSHFVDVMILSRLGVQEIIGTSDFPRNILEDQQIIDKSGEILIKNSEIPNVLDRIERSHAYSLRKKRLRLLDSVVHHLQKKNANVKQLTQWKGYVHNSQSVLFSVTPRIPQMEDLFDLDTFDISIEKPERVRKYLIYHTNLPEIRDSILHWAINDRGIELIDLNSFLES